MDVAESDVVQGAQLHLARRNVREEPERFLDGHLENVGDRLALVVDLERLAVVALAPAHLAGDVDVRQELHLDLDDPVAGARLTPTALDVEGEATGGVAAEARLGNGCEQLADRRGEAPGRCRGPKRRTADRRLVDVRFPVAGTHAPRGGASPGGVPWGPGCPRQAAGQGVCSP